MKTKMTSYAYHAYSSPQVLWHQLSACYSINNQAPWSRNQENSFTVSYQTIRTFTKTSRFAQCSNRILSIPKDKYTNFLKASEENAELMTIELTGLNPGVWRLEKFWWSSLIWSEYLSLMVTDNKKEAIHGPVHSSYFSQPHFSNKITTKMSCTTGEMMLDMVVLWSMGEAGWASLLLAGSRRGAHSLVFPLYHHFIMRKNSSFKCIFTIPSPRQNIEQSILHN